MDKYYAKISERIFMSWVVKITLINNKLSLYYPCYIDIILITGSSVGIIVGVVLGVGIFIVVIVAVLAVVYFRRKASKAAAIT